MTTLAVVYHPLETLEERARNLGELSVVLAEVGSDHALIGGIAVGFHGRLRATVDVDLLVPRDKLVALADALRARGYVIALTHDMLRVYPAGSDPAHAESIADLVAREANPVLESAARVAEPATVLGHRVRIVPRGALVALKFHAISLRRDIGDRYQDVADIGRVIAKRFRSMTCATAGPSRSSLDEACDELERIGSSSPSSENLSLFAGVGLQRRTHRRSPSTV